MLLPTRPAMDESKSISTLRWHSATKIGGCGGGTLAKKHHSLFRMIFPLMVLGSSSRNTTMRGYL